MLAGVRPVSVNVGGHGRAIQPKRISVINMWDRSTTSMHELVTEDNVQAMQEAVAQDPESVNQLNESGLPPLYTAALYRNRQAINFLLEHVRTGRRNHSTAA